MSSSVTLPVFAVENLTGSGQPSNNETVIIGAKTYKFQTSLTNVDGNVFIGTDLEATLQNLHDAINLTGTSGTQYATAMTRGAAVAISSSATVLALKAAAPGLIGNEIAVSGSYPASGDAAWDGSAFTSGAGADVDEFVKDLYTAGNQMNSEVMTELRKLTAAVD